LKKLARVVRLGLGLGWGLATIAATNVARPQPNDTTTATAKHQGNNIAPQQYHRLTQLVTQCTTIREMRSDNHRKEDMRAAAGPFSRFESRSLSPNHTSGCMSPRGSYGKAAPVHAPGRVVQPAQCGTRGLAGSTGGRIKRCRSTSPPSLTL
jgi:hypothetical protein